jgi:predicted PurR-regulated permease PerM
MQINLKPLAIFAGIFLVFFYLIYKFNFVFMPFILALIVAYLLDPMMDFFTKKLKISRSTSSIFIILIFLLLLFSFCFFVFPAIIGQVAILLDLSPKYLEHFSEKLQFLLADFFAKFQISLDPNLLNSQLSEISQKIAGYSYFSITDTAGFLINFISILFIMPVLVFYFLRDWNSIVKKIDVNLPKKYEKKIRELFGLIDKSLSSYIRGQVNICLILALYYVSLLSIIRLENSFIVGIMTGLFSFIPYVGYGVGFVFALMIGFFQENFGTMEITLLIAIYLFGQILESNFLVPSLIGKKIEIHPVWIIFGIFFFGALFGIFGVFFAIPLTAISGVVIKFISQEINSKKTKNYE